MQGDHVALARKGEPRGLGRGNHVALGAPFAMELRKPESKMKQRCRALS